MTRHNFRFISMVLLLSAATGCQLHPHPADPGADMLPPAPTPELPYHVTNMRVLTIPAASYLSSTTRTSFETIAGPAMDTIARLQQLTKSGAVHTSGSILFIYHDPSENPKTPFDVDIGVPLGDAPSGQLEGFNQRGLPAFHCASVIYRGPMKLLPKAYDKLIPEMIAAGLVPSDETRESYLTWDSPDSSANVVQIEVGIR